MKKIEIILMAMVLLLFTLGISQAYACSYTITYYSDISSAFQYNGNAPAEGAHNGNWKEVNLRSWFTDWIEEMGLDNKAYWNPDLRNLVVIKSGVFQGSGTGDGSAAPVPPAVLLLGSGLIGLMLFRGRRRD